MPILGLNGQPIGVDNLFHGIAQQPASSIKSTPVRQPAVPMQMPRRAPMSTQARAVPEPAPDAPHDILSQSNVNAPLGVELPGQPAPKRAGAGPLRRPAQPGSSPLGEPSLF